MLISKRHDPVTDERTRVLDCLDPLPFDLLGRLALAVLLGGIVGFEREISGKPAGLRTNILICLGSALLMDLSITIGMIDGGERIGDPARIAAQMVTGVGFLGAGTIMQARGEVIGLTTAATIWVVAAIGLRSAPGTTRRRCAAALLVTLVLAGLGWLERWMLACRRVVTGTIHDASRRPVRGDRRRSSASRGSHSVEEGDRRSRRTRTFELSSSGRRAVRSPGRGANAPAAKWSASSSTER